MPTDYAAVDRARAALHAAERQFLDDLAEVSRLIDSAVTAVESGDRVEASRLLTAAVDLAFATIGDADAIDPLFAALGVSDGVSDEEMESAAARTPDTRPYHERRLEMPHCPECLRQDCFSVACDEKPE